MENVFGLFGGLTILLGIILLVLWILLPFLVDAIRGHVRAIRRQLEVQNQHLSEIREELDRQSHLR